jgi:vacuolar-type H+-ATPase subunit F/Vma7
MSRLLVIIRPELAAGFALAGVEAFPAADVETAVEQIEAWLRSKESGLLAIDEALLEKMDPAFLRRLEAAEHLPFIAIPGGYGADDVIFRRRRISELTRRAIGFHSIFQSDKTEAEEK